MVSPPEGLSVTSAGGVLRLTFERPDLLNALTGEMTHRLAEEVEAATGRDDVRVVLVSGAGGSFSAGADVSGPDAHEQFDVRAVDLANRVVRALVSCDKPCVAAVDGVAAGVGCSIALACDLVVASESAVFLLAFARIGLMPDGGASATVAASIGRARAMRMSLLAEPLSGREAYDAGLVSHVAEGAAFTETVDDIVARLARGAPLAQAATKKAVNAATLSGLEAALERERAGQTVLLRTDDVAEGMRAFGERRRPQFRGA